MFCTPAEVLEQDDHDAVRRDGTGNGTVAFAVDQSGDRSLLLSDAGCDEFHPAELWHLSAVVSSGDLSVCDQVRPGHDWLWNDRKYVLSGIYF